ncbi:MAG: helix-turn-helix domain-containing protein, partial [Anaeromyxobacter sp.]
RIEARLDEQEAARPSTGSSVRSDRDWLTAQELAQVYGFPSTRAVYLAVRRGTIPARRVGRLLRFLRSDVEAAFKAR